jgi:hypothetical protein
MHTQTTTDDTTFAATRKPMHTETTTQPTARRPFTVYRARPDRVAPPEHVDELRASQLVSVAAEEIEWFFTSTDTDGPALQARAIIEGWFCTLGSAEQRALALRFDPTPWPAALQAEGLESGYALALTLVSTTPWRPESRPHCGPHRRASEHLEAAVRERGISVMRAISRRADWDFASAVRAYAKARGRAPSVLPRRVCPSPAIARCA